MSVSKQNITQQCLPQDQLCEAKDCVVHSTGVTGTVIPVSLFVQKFRK